MQRRDYSKMSPNPGDIQNRMKPPTKESTMVQHDTSNPGDPEKFDPNTPPPGASIMPNSGNPGSPHPVPPDGQPELPFEDTPQTPMEGYPPELPPGGVVTDAPLDEMRPPEPPETA